MEELDCEGRNLGLEVIASICVDADSPEKTTSKRL